jgi:putative salt-induced outer membrane protein YdiY
MRRTHTLFVALIVLAAQVAIADQITFKNGDRLTGVIVKSDGKALTLKSEYAGLVTVPVEAVDKIVSDQPLHVTLKDGQTVVGTVTTDADKLQVKTAETGLVSLARDSIVTVRSNDEQAAWQLQEDRLRNPSLLDLWNGTLDLGLALTGGNAKTSSFNFGVTAARTTPRDKISVYTTTLYARNSTTGTSITTANARRGGARYDVNMTSRSFAFGLGDLESDEFQKLDLRMSLGGGFGWHAVKAERVLFDVFGGGSLNKEYFTQGLRRTSGEMLVGQELTYKLAGRTSYKEKAVIFPNMSETGEYRMMFDNSLVTSLSRWLAWNITFSDRYLSNPVFGTKANDMLLATGLRVTFGR